MVPFKRKRNERFVSNIAYNNGMVKDNIIGSDIFTTEIKKISRSSKGYVSYFSSNYVRLGSIYEITNINIDNTQEFGKLDNVFRSKVLDKLKSGKIYRMLVSVKYEVDGIVKGSSPMKSIMITCSIS